MWLFLYFFEFVFKDRQQTVGKDAVDLRFRQFIPVFIGIRYICDEYKLKKVQER